MSVNLLQPYSRLRSKGGLVPGVSLTDVGSGPVSNYSSVVGKGVAVGTHKVMTDVVTPRFKRLVAAGQVTFSPMSSIEWIHKPAAANSHQLTQVTPGWAVGQTYTGTGDLVSQVLSGITPPDDRIPESFAPKTVISQSVIDRMISEACTKAQRIPSEANLLVTIAEARKTMRLVPDLWSNWNKFFQSFHGKVGYLYGRHLKANPKRQSAANLQALREVTQDTWLAMRFAVRPLVMDTVGVIKALGTELSDKPVRVAQRGTVQVFGSEVVNQNVIRGINTFQVSSSHSHDTKVRAMSLFEMSQDSYEARTGLHWSHVPEAVIDLVSYSFVINWVLTLNDFFSALGQIAHPGIRTVGSCYVLTEDKSVTHQLLTSYCNDPTYTTSIAAMGVSTVTCRSKTRIVGLRAPSIVLRADPFKFLRDARLVDAIALMSKASRFKIRF